MPVNIPGATNAVAVKGDNMTIQVAKSGKIYINKKLTSRSELKAQIKKYISPSSVRPVLLEADTKSDYGRIVNILDLIRSCGATNVGLSTKPVK